MNWEETQVEATFTTSGDPIPRSLTWQGETLSIVGSGRRWKAEDGYHLLARVGDGRVFELHTNLAKWWACLRSAPPNRA